MKAGIAVFETGIDYILDNRWTFLINSKWVHFKQGWDG